MKKGKKWKTVFRTRYELFEYLIMPFELINASAIFQVIINDTLQNILNIFVIVYFDDIIIYFQEILAEYKKHIKKIFRKFYEKNLKVNVRKYEFYKIEIKYLENVVKRNNIKMNFDKIKFI